MDSGRRIGNAIPYNIVIRPSDNMGFIVRIGCNAKTLEGPGALLVAENGNALLSLLEIYFSDPKGCLKDYEGMCKEAPIAEAIRPETDAGTGIGEVEVARDTEPGAERRE